MLNQCLFRFYSWSDGWRALRVWMERVWVLAYNVLCSFRNFSIRLRSNVTPLIKYLFVLRVFSHDKWEAWAGSIYIYIRHSLSENIFSILWVRLFVFFKLRLRAPRNLEKCFGKWHWQVCNTLFFKHLEPCSKLRKILNKYPTLNREIDCLILNLFRFSFVPVL